VADYLALRRRNMAKNEEKRLKPDKLDEDITSFEAWAAMAGYQPNNPNLATGPVKANRAALEAAQMAEVQAKAAFDAARDNAVKAEWDFHNLILGVKDQVASQYGRDSNEYQALGLKKKSERKAPTRKK
jgi:hypothetical protein